MRESKYPQTIDYEYPEEPYRVNEVKCPGLTSIYKVRPNDPPEKYLTSIDMKRSFEKILPGLFWGMEKSEVEKIFGLSNEEGGEDGEDAANASSYCLGEEPCDSIYFTYERNKLTSIHFSTGSF